MNVENAVKYGNETPEQLHNSYGTMMRYEIADYIDDAPTVEAVEVVRCRECAGRKKNKFCIEWLKYVPDDGFCHLGAKMEGDACEG